MIEQADAVNAHRRDTVEFPSAEGDDSGPRNRVPERPAARFSFPGGSRPLDGYTIKRGIGHGGFGEIYYALSDAGKEVALKLIRRNLDIELRGISHCLNLKHPNLLVLYDIRQDDQGDTWVVMEYVSGGCLSDAIAKYPDGMPADQALHWLRGTAAGVAHLHDRGIVHRDLKPGNIFCEEGLVKVGDYGLSKFISCSRRSGQTESVGTVHYMAPEVANGRYGKEVDVYALGVILHEMLTGRVPFEGESVGEVLMKHLTAEPDLSRLAEPYRSVVARALQKDPTKRFRNVSEMLAALPTPGTPLPGAERLPPGAYGPAGRPYCPPPPPGHAGGQTPVDDEEPIYKAVRENCQKLQAAWNDANLNTPAKVLILLALAFVVLLNIQVLLPLAVLLALCYGGYWIVRTLVRSGQSPSHGRHTPDPHRGPPPPPSAPPAPVRAPVAPVAMRVSPARPARRGRREEAAVALVLKSPKERLTDLVGSLLAGGLVAVATSIVAVLIGGLVADDSSQTADFQRYSEYGWLVLMGIAGTWAVLIPSKFWEGTRGEAVLRRFIMMVVGLGLGVLAFVVAGLFAVDLNIGPDFGIDPMVAQHQLSQDFYTAYGRPQLLAFLACFGTLFLLVRWWRQADPLRPARLSLWSVFVSLVAAGLVASMCAFEQEAWPIMLAGVVSVSVQLASPWVPPRERARRKKV